MSEHHHMAGSDACPHKDCVAKSTPVSPAITPADIDNLRHMLGVDYDKSRKRWGYRNYYVTSPTDPSMHRLVACGFARLVVQDSRDATFCATRDGCLAVGMLPRDIDKMEPRV